MDNNQNNNRPDPKNNPFNQNASNASAPEGEYDEFGNRIETQDLDNRGTTQNFTQNNPSSEASSGPGSQPASGQASSLAQSEPKIISFEDDDLSQNPAPPNSPASPQPPIPQPPSAQVYQPVSQVVAADLSIAGPAAVNTYKVEEPPKAQGKGLNKMKSAKTLIAAVVVVITAGILLAAGFILKADIPLPFAKVSPQQVTTPESLAERVKSIVDLPIEEEPSQILNVNDIKALPDSNPFSKVAQIGDLILVYEKNKTAILFRPTSGKVVSMGKLDRSQADVAGASSEDATPTPTPLSDSAAEEFTPAPTETQPSPTSVITNSSNSN